jgi:CYTH domain-containing protein
LFVVLDGRGPGEGRYAHIEREQRWLVGTPPVLDGPPIEIADRYLTGTRLRLRRASNGSTVVYKLGQKVRVDPGNPELVKLTNLYLSEAEYTMLRQLDGADLVKTRWRIAVEGRPAAMDVFGSGLDGLVLAEIELGTEDSLLGLPSFAVADVTRDDRFSGGFLAYLGGAGQQAFVTELGAIHTSS